MAITYQAAKEHDTLKEGRATRSARMGSVYSLFVCVVGAVFVVFVW